MKLNEIHDIKQISKNKKRIGRGIGSGTGKTSGKGHKGQKARSGVAIKGFEGGQMPIHRRLPKRGFTNIFRKEYVPINIGIIQKLIDENKLPSNKSLDNEVFLTAGLIKKSEAKIKILGNGKLESKVEIVASGFSKKAKNQIEKVGGKISLKNFKKINKSKITTNEKNLNGK